MARSVQEITSFTLVSIIIIIHNVINNKVFLYTVFGSLISARSTMHLSFPYRNILAARRQ